MAPPRIGPARGSARAQEGLTAPRPPRAGRPEVGSAQYRAQLGVLRLSDWRPRSSPAVPRRPVPARTALGRCDWGAMPRMAEATTRCPPAAPPGALRGATDRAPALLRAHWAQVAGVRPLDPAVLPGRHPGLPVRLQLRRGWLPALPQPGQRARAGPALQAGAAGCAPAGPRVVTSRDGLGSSRLGRRRRSQAGRRHQEPQAQGRQGPPQQLAQQGPAARALRRRPDPAPASPAPAPAAAAVPPAPAPGAASAGPRTQAGAARLPLRAGGLALCGQGQPDRVRLCPPGGLPLPGCTPPAQPLRGRDLHQAAPGGLHALRRLPGPHPDGHLQRGAAGPCWLVRAAPGTRAGCMAQGTPTAHWPAAYGASVCHHAGAALRPWQAGVGRAWCPAACMCGRPLRRHWWAA